MTEEGSPDWPTTSRGPKVNQIQCLATAIRFLTRVHLPCAENHSHAHYTELLRGSVVYFPFVGGLIGLFTAAVMLASLSVGMSALLAAIIALGLEATLPVLFTKMLLPTVVMGSAVVGRGSVFSRS